MSAPHRKYSARDVCLCGVSWERKWAIPCPVLKEFVCAFLGPTDVGVPGGVGMGLGAGMGVGVDLGMDLGAGVVVGLGVVCERHGRRCERGRGRGHGEKSEEPG